MIHITNGDCAVAVLAQAVQGTILPWRDVLHEGPVRAGLLLKELSRERARFVADAFAVPVLEAEKQFQERDAAFRRAGEHDEIVLWFEHDLYDQLQLIQVLDGLSDLRGPPVFWVCETEYLGTMSAERAAELFSLRSPVTRRHMQDAGAAWKAFRAPDPRELEKVKAPSLPFLAAALRRQMQEFPWTSDGLSLLERNVLHALRSGAAAFPDIFLAVREDPAFLGDAVLAWHLERLAREGLVAREGDGWRSTGKQRQQRLPRWLGGYEVKNESVRWDPGLGRLAA